MRSLISMLTSGWSAPGIVVGSVHFLAYFMIMKVAVIQPQRAFVAGADPASLKDFDFTWTAVGWFVFVLAVVGCEIWPAMLLIVVFDLALSDRSLGLLRFIPSFRRVDELADLIWAVCVAQRAKTDEMAARVRWARWWRRKRAHWRGLSARQDAVSFALFAAMAPGFELSLLAACLLQPLATLLRGNGWSKLHWEMLATSGSGIAACFFVALPIIWLTMVTYCETYLDAYPPSEQEVQEATEWLEGRYERMSGGGVKFNLRATALAALSIAGVVAATRGRALF